MKKVSNPFHLGLNNATAVRDGLFEVRLLAMACEDKCRITSIGLPPVETPDTFCRLSTRRNLPPSQFEPAASPSASDEQVICSVIAAGSRSYQEETHASPTIPPRSLPNYGATIGIPHAIASIKTFPKDSSLHRCKNTSADL